MTASPARLTQDPHRPAAPRERVLEVAIGREMRALRQAQRMTVAELGQKSGLSAGMLSKIENGQASPSLTTLNALATALSVPLTEDERPNSPRIAKAHDSDADDQRDGRVGALTAAMHTGDRPKDVVRSRFVCMDDRQFVRQHIEQHFRIGTGAQAHSGGCAE